jgi:hypothetical protein
VKRTIEQLVCLGILCVTITCFCQITYTATDLGTLPNSNGSIAFAVNDSGQVVGEASGINGNSTEAGDAAVLWAQPGASAQTIVPASFNVPHGSYAQAINNSGQVVGFLNNHYSPFLYNSKTGAFEIIGTDVGLIGVPFGINQRGIVTGNGTVASRSDRSFIAFTYDGTNVILHPGPNGYGYSGASSINDFGDLAGAVSSSVTGVPAIYNSASSSWITFSVPSRIGSLSGINDNGWAAGNWRDNPSGGFHPLVVRKDGVIINLTPPANTEIVLEAVNNAGLAVGYDATSSYRAFAYDIPTDKWIDLSTRVVNPGLISLNVAFGISSDGKIVGWGFVQGKIHAFLLTPIPLYKALVQPPINPNGNSTFNAARGAVPVKFALTKDDASTCTLPPATISVTRTKGATPGFVDASTYESPADKTGPHFSIDSCQYTYILRTKELGAGNYRVDINIEGNIVGSGEFALK